MPLTVLRHEDLQKTLKEIFKLKAAQAEVEKEYNWLDDNTNPYAVCPKHTEDEFKILFKSIQSKKQSVRLRYLAIWDYLRNAYETIDKRVQNRMIMYGKALSVDASFKHDIECLVVLRTQIKHVVDLLNGEKPVEVDGILEVAYYDQVE